MKLSKALNPKFQELLGKLVIAEVPMKAAFKIKKISNDIDESVKGYEIARIEIIKKFAELNDEGDLKSDAQGNAIFISDESRMEFAQELSGLLNVDIGVNKVLVDELGDKLSFSAVDLVILEDLIE